LYPISVVLLADSASIRKSRDSRALPWYIY
jgi:hypothetical protein